MALDFSKFLAPGQVPFDTNAWLANAKANYKGEPGFEGVRGFNPYTKDPLGGEEMLSLGLVTTGLRGAADNQYGVDIGGENTNWMVNPDTGREEPALAGPDGKYYLLSDVIRKYGSIENAARAAYAADPSGENVQAFGGGGSVRGSNDTFSGKDGLRDLVTIAAMASPVIAGAAGLYGAAGSAAGDAAIVGGEGVVSGSGTAATGVAGAGTTNAGVAAMGDWWTELGLTAADVGMESTPFTTDPSFADLGGNVSGGSGGYDLAQIAKQYGPQVATILGRLAPAAFGAYASNKQTGALQDLAGKYAEYGAPSRGRYEASMAPGFDPMSIPGYSGALDTASKSLMARLSATGGNPYGNPGGLIDANKQIVAGTALPAVQEYQRLNAATGFGTTLNSAGTMSANAIGSNANMYNAIGAGAADVLNPPKSLAEQMDEFRRAGLFTKNSLS